MLTPGFQSAPTVAEARDLQERLRHDLVVADRFGPVRTVAGVDVGYSRRDNLCRASVVLLEFDSLEVLDAAAADQPPAFPYIPGYLSFREVPVVLEALAALGARPDLLMVDGQGYAHPRRIGVASHLGLVADIASVGVAKSRLIGTHADPGWKKGSSVPLVDGGERVGSVLRSRDNVRPLFVSPGHRVGFDTAVELVVACLTRYRLPEPTRLADKFSKFPRR